MVYDYVAGERSEDLRLTYVLSERINLLSCQLGNAFKREKTIPQLLMQWCASALVSVVALTGHFFRKPISLSALT